MKAQDMPAADYTFEGPAVFAAVGAPPFAATGKAPGGPADFSAKFDRVCLVLDKYGRNPHKLIAILQEIQAEYKYLPEEIMTYISTALGISPSAVYGVATFYSHFTLEAKGKYVIKVCDGTACHVRKSQAVITVLERELGLFGGKRTTDDRLFTLETVACLGTCGLAPVAVVNDEAYGAMTPEKTAALLNEIRAKERGHD